ncbi:tRNA uridine-5-carboxymethylaminomethyl(34) synthesis GTPase MnmE [Chlamydiales bacterium]|nr:tRNA uridine-5-carboxymethylaminomethyl(34) synthesis GTPase MnmE [Chlamydiales bacterium]
MNRTIAAIATPPGNGGVAIIRISGDQAFSIAGAVFSRTIENIPSHTVHFGQILTAEKTIIDDVLLVIMKGPKTFTGEDVIEIQCHGGHLVSRRVLNRVLEAGALPAEPGEFSFKAFLNNKIDLTQAEAIQALVGAKNEKALDAAQKHLEGKLSKEILSFKKNLTTLSAVLEASVDFPEEGLEFNSLDEIQNTLKKHISKMEKLSETYHDGKIAHQGVHIALIGAPNVGKSSLMNLLLNKERAIVSPIQGTTRDLVEDHMMLGDLNVLMTDTAGIRDTGEEIEEEGIRRSKKMIEEADLILYLIDPEKESRDPIKELLPENKTVFIWNKCDLKKTVNPAWFMISCKTGEGIESLKEIITEKIWQKGPPSKEEILITNVRHKEALDKAILHAKSTYKGLNEGVSPEFMISDLRESLKSLGVIIGSDIQEDVLSSIFSQFCVGK